VEGCPLAWSQFNGSCYWVVQDGMAWLEAREKCREMGSDLASSLSRAENDFINSLCTGRCEISTYMWLGGIDSGSEGRWTWVDGRKFEYTHWQTWSGNKGPQANCIGYHIKRGDWMDMGCFDKLSLDNNCSRV
jgi:hypothetical protein